MGSDTKKFLDIIGKHLHRTTGDVLAKDFLLQKISVEIQRNSNAASVLCSFKRDGDINVVCKVKNIFKMLQLNQNNFFLSLQKLYQYILVDLYFFLFY